MFVSLLASPAGAKIIFDKVTGQKLSILAPPSRLAAPRSHTARNQRNLAPTCSTTVDPNCGNPLTYHGGAVQHAENDYLFFWDPSGFASAPGYETGMQTWLSDVAASNYTTGNSASFVGNPISVTQQYYDLSGPGKTKRFVQYDVTNAGTIMDTNPFPASGCTDSEGPGKPAFPLCLTQQQLYNQLSTYITNPAHRYPTGVNTEYFILTPPGVGGCSDSHNTDCFVGQYCAWHSVGGNSSGLIVYAFQPYLYNTGCDVNKALSMPYIYSNGIDPVVGTFSHELSESMTDPTLSGWYSNSFDEIGDKCAYQYDVGRSYYDFTDLPQTGSNAYYNSVFGSDGYLLQTEFDNRNHGCNQWDTDVQPSATLTVPASDVVTGLPATFSLSNYAGAVGTNVAYVTWHFGDGSTAVSTGTASINHYYQHAAGPYTATAVVTDTHGNEVVETAGTTFSSIAPQQSDLQTAVNAPIKPSGAAAKIGPIVTNGGYTFSFSALTAGTFHMAWKHAATTVATVTKALSILGPNKLKIALTPAGRSLLNSHNSVSIASTDSYVASGYTTATDAASFTLVR